MAIGLHAVRATLTQVPVHSPTYGHLTQPTAHPSGSDSPDDEQGPHGPEIDLAIAATIAPARRPPVSVSQN